MPDDQQQNAKPEPNRRQWLGGVSLTAMAAGLVAGYGSLGAMAVRFLYPSRPADRQWMFVAPLDRLQANESLLYRAPSGATVNITRKATVGDASDFVALSSVCPHLGCSVHWEAQNDRYFCPCHNGVFDPEGRGVSGPPGDAGQALARYELQVDGGLLYIRVATESLAENGAGEVTQPLRSRPGHDPCLAPTRDTKRDSRA